MTINDDIDEKINNYILEYKNNIKSNKFNRQSKYEIKNLVLSGGGPKGISHIGALKSLEKHGILKNIKAIASASIGGVIASLFCIGYSPDELYSFIDMFDTSKFNCFDPSHLFKTFGLDDGNRFEMIIGKLFEAKKVSKDITFKELYKLSGIKLIMSTVCLNDKQTYYLSYLNYPDMKVVTGIRMTTSIPLIFCPVSYQGKLFIDGGCNDNYPMHLFHDELNATIGVYLRGKSVYKKNIISIEDFLFCLIKSFNEGVMCNLIKGYEKRTVVINGPAIELTDFCVSQELKKELFNCGVSSMEKFLKN